MTDKAPLSGIDELTLLKESPLPALRVTQKKPLNTSSSTANTVAGFIDTIEGNIIHGWVFSPTEKITPILLVNGSPATLTKFPEPRDDVSSILGVPDPTGFYFKFPNFSGPSLIQLYAITSTGLLLVDEKTFDAHSTSSCNFLSQLDKAVAISQLPDAVAIANWDDNHNPIGRAKVLYDIAALKRPTLLISYSFSEFGSELWKPISDLPFNFLSIPWNNRESYEDLIRSVGLTFPTIWLCKPRYPNFLLTKLIASEHTKLVLDLDDNDFFFSQSRASKNKVYGSLTLNQCRYYTSRITSRTAASCSLAEEFEAHMVRHVREPYKDAVSLFEKKELDQAEKETALLAPESSEELSEELSEDTDTDTDTDTDKQVESLSDSILKIGFIGTVRQHKGLIEAARALRILSWKLKNQVEFHVCGDIRPNELIETLQSYGVITHPTVPRSKLYEKLSEFDVILAGYPAQNAEPEITNYQISAKIGDALAVKRPVLVPLSPSTQDLTNIDGVFLFTEENLMASLQQARDYFSPISLPEQFTLEGGYESFSAVEANAVTANQVGLYDHTARQSKVISQKHIKPTIVLIWKQQDAGIYGRRIDQIARYYKRVFKSHKVIILELMHTKKYEDYQKHSGAFNNETTKIVQFAERKIMSMEDVDGVIYQQIHYYSSDLLKDTLQNYFLENQIFPSNSIIAFFPVIMNIEKTYDLFNDYKIIVDFVDNQTAWEKNDGPSKVLPQYIQMARMADRILFNSEENAEAFEELGIINNQMKSYIVRNWFIPPIDLGDSAENIITTNRHQILYSGNLNDRLNWDLLEKIADTYPNAILNIAGSIRQDVDNMLRNLLERENVHYHGPLTERDVVAMLQTSSVAIVPHTISEVSRFMNPLKVEMYKAMEVPVVASDVPGITDEEGIIVAQSDEDFVRIIGEIFNEKITTTPSGVPLQQKLATNYIKIIEDLRNE